MTSLYGIKNCDTVKKARNWLDLHGIDYSFYDVRQDGLELKQVNMWLKELGWETLVNRRSTTWKQLDPAIREQMDDTVAAAQIMSHPTLIKRPVLDLGEVRHVGFSAEQYQHIFDQHTL